MTFKIWARRNQDPASMAPVLKWRPRRTNIDLYTERDNVKWYWRIAANLSAFMIMSGFLIFPSAFENNADLAVDQSTASVAAIVLLALGYTVSVALWFICTSWLFQLDIIFLPCLLTCVFGLFNVTYNLNIRSPSTPHWNSSSISALALATISTLIYSILSLITFRKIHIVRARDAMHRHTAESESIHIDPEDEQQRQQLLRLLQQRENTKKITPQASQSTFHINIPVSPRRSSTNVSTPSNIYDRSRSAPHVPILPNWPPPSNPDPNYTTSEMMPQRMVEPPIDPRTVHMELALPYNPDAAPDHNVPCIVNTHYPLDKAEEAGFSLGLNPTLLTERHPLERGRAQYRMETEEEEDRRRRSASRESRRVEIEMETRSKDKRDIERREELEGVEIVPRIVRVETDGWGKRMAR